jgi:hypothetical protein
VNREQLAHVVRAAATVVGVDDVIVLGSQAILATVDDVELPYEVTRSIEADIAVDHEISRISLGVDRADLALLIEGALGEGSMFHATYGYYAEGVEIEVAVLAEGWRERLVPLISESVAGAKVGWCLSASDVWISKAAAGRTKDAEYCTALAAASLVDRADLERLARAIGMPHRASIDRVMARSFS